jgi:hypothetical protein
VHIPHISTAQKGKLSTPPDASPERLADEAGWRLTGPVP